MFLIAGLVAYSTPVLAAGGLQKVAPPSGTASGELVPALQKIINYFLILAGIVALAFIILGGVRYITSQGDDKAAAQGKNTVLFAVIGLLVIGLAAAIVNFVLGSFQ